MLCLGLPRGGRYVTGSGFAVFAVNERKGVKFSSMTAYFLDTFFYARPPVVFASLRSCESNSARLDYCINCCRVIRYGALSEILDVLGKAYRKHKAYMVLIASWQYCASSRCVLVLFFRFFSC